MERLTERNADGKVVLRDPAAIQAALDRLAAYEDKGVAPEDTLSALDMAKATCALLDYRSLGDYDHLKKLVQMGKDGKLVELPTPVGSEIYLLMDGEEPRIEQGVISSFFCYKTERYFSVKLLSGNSVDVPLGELGYSAFLSLEAAKKRWEFGQTPNVFVSRAKPTLLVLECKPGDCIYVLLKDRHIQEAVIQDMTVSAGRSDVILHLGGWPPITLWGRDKGKTWFTSYQEAEAEKKRQEEATSI